MKKQPDITEATRMHILDAFWQLYKQMPLEKISVNAIATNANVHRSTFYRYFADIQDVLDTFENELLKKIKEDGLYNLSKFITILKEMPSEEVLKEGDAFISTILMKHAEKIYFLTNARGDSHFKSKLYDWLRQETYDFISPPQNFVEFDYIFTLIFTISITHTNYCYEHRNEYDPKTITAISRTALKNCADLLLV